MSVKKVFQPIIAHLEANPDVKVKSILAAIIDMCSAKSAGGGTTASHKDAEGNVVAVRCAYFGVWFPISHVEFGKKEGSATGLNSMCKEGANMFSQKQREFKNAKEKLMERVIAGTLKPENIAAEVAKLEKIRTTVPEYSVEGMGWETLEECTKQTPTSLDRLVKAQKQRDAEEAKEADAAKTEAKAEVEKASVETKSKNLWFSKTS
jgi:hypothetical protein